jgi:hypothetical protein
MFIARYCFVQIIARLRSTCMIAKCEHIALLTECPTFVGVDGYKH